MFNKYLFPAFSKLKYFLCDKEFTDIDLLSKETAIALGVHLQSFVTVTNKGIKSFAVDHRKKFLFILSLSIFVISFFNFFPRGYSVGYDQIGYFTMAKNFANDLGMVDPTGSVSYYRFGYKYLAATIFKIFGTDNFLAIYVFHRFCLSMFLVAVFLIGVELFSLFTATLTATIIMFSIDYNRIIGWATDGVVNFLFAWSFLLLITVYRSNLIKSYRDNFYLVLSALLLALSFFMKETVVVLFMPVPLLFCFFKGYKISAHKLVTLYLIFFAVISSVVFLLPFSPFATPEAYNESLGVKAGLEFAANSYTNNSLISTLCSFFIGAYRFFYSTDLSRGVESYLSIIVLLPLAVIVSFVRVLKKKTDAKLLLLMVVAMYIPYMGWNGLWDMRTQQLLFISAITVLVIIDSLKDVIAQLFARAKIKMVSLNFIYVIIFSVVLLNMAEINLKYSSVIEGRVKLKEMSEFLKTQIKPDENILVADVSSQMRVGWFLYPNHKVFLMPYKRSGIVIGNAYTEHLEDVNDRQDFITFHSNFSNFKREYYPALLLSNNEITALIEDNNIKYIVMDNDRHHKDAAEWLKEHKGLEEIKSKRRSFSHSVFKVKADFAKHKAPTKYVAENFAVKLRDKKNTHHYFYKWHVDNLLFKAMGLNNSEVKAILDED